jgi:YbbR domain-containing protein
MMLTPFRLLLKNLGTLLLAFALALVVWVSAVTAADPNVERTRTVPLEVIGQDANLILMSNLPTQIRVTMRAPRSVADRISNTENSIHAWIDLTGVGTGTHVVPVQTRILESYHPVRLMQVSPESVVVTLEPLVSRKMDVKVTINGEPALGYQKGLPSRKPTYVTLSGPESLVAQVAEVYAALDISDATETVKEELPLLAIDANGQPVYGVTITPSKIEVTQPISLLGGYRNVVVKVVTIGQVASGYKLTNISVSPPNVVVFSTDPQLVNELPSFVETKPLDLSGAEDDIEALLALDLPPGISVVGDQSVLVQVSIAAIEGSLTITLPVQTSGLLPTYTAQISPPSVDVFLSGPVPVLDKLKPTDIRVVADLKGLEVGVHQVQLLVDVLPERLQVESILPSVVEVTIAPHPTQTPMSSPTPTATTQP